MNDVLQIVYFYFQYTNLSHRFFSILDITWSDLLLLMIWQFFFVNEILQNILLQRDTRLIPLNLSQIFCLSGKLTGKCLVSTYINSSITDVYHTLYLWPHFCHRRWQEFVHMDCFLPNYHTAFVFVNSAHLCHLKYLPTGKTMREILTGKKKL